MSDVEINAETVIVESGNEEDEAWQSESPSITADLTTTAGNLPTEVETMLIAETAIIVQTAATVAEAAAIVAQASDPSNDPTNSTLEMILIELREIKMGMNVVADATTEVVQENRLDSELEPLSLEGEATATELTSVTVEVEPVRTPGAKADKAPSVPEKRHGRRWRTNLLNRKSRQ